MEHSKESDRFFTESFGMQFASSIWLFGGEPLLEFELIKKCVAYINQIFFGKRKTFVITTNATLLNEEKLIFSK